VATTFQHYGIGQYGVQKNINNTPVVQMPEQWGQH